MIVQYRVVGTRAETKLWSFKYNAMKSKRKIAKRRTQLGVIQLFSEPYLIADLDSVL